MSRSCLHSSRTRRVRTLNVRWQFHYEFIYFDVPKVVRSPGCDHGLDDESRNGRDIKIDILDDYIRTSKRFRVIRVFFGVPESFGNSPGSIWTLLGHTGKKKKGLKGGRTPPLGLVRIGLGKGGAPFLLLLSPFLPLSYSNKERRSPTPGGSRTPPLARPPWPAASPPCSFIYGGRGAPLDTQVDLLISPSRVRFPLHHIPPR